MNERAFSDDPAPTPAGLRAQLASHALVAGVVLSVGALAVGMHTATAAVAIVGAGHLVVVGSIAALVRARRRRAERAVT